MDIFTICQPVNRVNVNENKAKMSKNFTRAFACDTPKVTRKNSYVCVARKVNAITYFWNSRQQRLMPGFYFYLVERSPYAAFAMPFAACGRFGIFRGACFKEVGMFHTVQHRRQPW